MKWQIGKHIVVASICLGAMTAKAQVVTSNPGEYLALIEGNELINSQYKSQMNGEQQTAILQNAIAAEFTQMKSWEKKYNSYLKSASGYASTLKACSYLYNDGVRIFINLCKLQKAINSNPQGIVASMSMNRRSSESNAELVRGLPSRDGGRALLNNLYIETATELVSVFTLLNDAVAKGGKENMLTGADRSKTLWALNDKLAAFNKKLSQLHLSIRYYTLNDVWQNVSAGMIDRSNGEIAHNAMSRWRRAAKVASP